MILFKIGKNFKFGQNLHKNISILLETSQFWSKFLKIVILVKFVKKSWLKSKFSKYLDFG